MGDHFRVRFLSQPEVFVDHSVVMNLGGLGFLLSNRYSQRIGLGKAGNV